MRQLLPHQRKRGVGPICSAHVISLRLGTREPLSVQEVVRLMDQTDRPAEL
jgi:hypothetical protein